MEHLYRKNDGMILVCQNNDDQSILIYGINDVAQKLLGVDENEMKGKALVEIVPRRIRDSIDEFIEYEDESNRDVYSVLNRLRDFRFLNREGEEVPVSLKVARAQAKDRNQWFQLIIKDEVYQREVDSFKQILRDNFKGHEVLDSETQLPDRKSILKDIEIAHYYATSKGLEACYAYFRLDSFEELKRQHGLKEALEGLNHVAANLRRNLRTDDTIGRVATDAIGVILMNITLDSARVVLNRLRWGVTSEEMKLASGGGKALSISIAFGKLGEEKGDTLPVRCEEELAKNRTPNVIIEVA